MSTTTTTATPPPRDTSNDVTRLEAFLYIVIAVLLLWGVLALGWFGLVSPISLSGVILVMGLAAATFLGVTEHYRWAIAALVLAVLAPIIGWAASARGIDLNIGGGVITWAIAAAILIFASLGGVYIYKRWIKGL